MRKSFFLISFLIIGFAASTFGQDTLALTFSAQNNDQQVPLDSILIINLTQGGDTVLYSPDTVLILYIPPPQGINDLNQRSANNFSVSPNYPNPCISQTSIDVCIDRKDNIEIRIFDLSGREHASYMGVFDAGKHTFTFNPGNQNFYIFSATSCGLTRSIKIANLLSGKRNCELTYTGFEKQSVNLKSHPDGNFPFDPGNELRYIGYSKTTQGIRGSDVIEDDPEENESYTFDITEGIPCVNVPTVSYELREYNTVQIGTQCWLKENLNVGTMIPGVQHQLDNGTIEKFCYDDDPANCAIYGGLYQWDEMMIYTTEPGGQGICPPGWHIPADEEWKQLEGEVDSQYGYPDPIWDSLGYRGSDIGSKLKSRHSWESSGNGIDYVGFCALATGCCIWTVSNSSFVNMGNYTSLWSSEQTTVDESWYRYMEYWVVQVARYSRTQDFGRSVRCIMDE